MSKRGYSTLFGAENHPIAFSHNHRSGYGKSLPHRVVGPEEVELKPLLYVYRVLLTGIHLMRTGVVNANLVDFACLVERPSSG